LKSRDPQARVRDRAGLVGQSHFGGRSNRLRFLPLMHDFPAERAGCVRSRVGERCCPAAAPPRLRPEYRPYRFAVQLPGVFATARWLRVRFVETDSCIQSVTLADCLRKWRCKSRSKDGQLTLVHSISLSRQAHRLAPELTSPSSERFVQPALALPLHLSARIR
jgi:hypothetical protein